MRGLPLTALCSVLVLGVAACSGGGNKTTNNMVTSNSSSTSAAPATGGAGTGNAQASTASAWPEGSRIVSENGVTYRVDRTGARVRLEPGDSRIVVENGTRYRVDAGGTRVRIDQSGAAVRIGDSTIKGNAPNGRSDVETPGEALSDAGEDAAEAVADVVD
ncbi:MAG TPA: hypothetical protein VGB54_13800 [Allosphingosinicella sp.]